MRLETEDGKPLFKVDGRDPSTSAKALAYIRPCGPGAPQLIAQSTVAWPVCVPLRQLPPLASRLGFRALPARLAYALRTRTRALLLFALLGASPLWGGYLVSQLVSA